MMGIIILLAILSLSSASRFANATHTTNGLVGFIGGIVDCGTRVGREERIAMEMAIEDFHNSTTGDKLVLKLRDLSGNSARSAFAAIDLIKTQQVQAIVGSLTWQEAALVNQMDDMISEVPIISLVTPTIFSSPIRAQFLPVIHMGHDIALHMRCIAAIIGFFRWQKVIAIHEDRNDYSNDLSIITYLSDALREVGADLEHYSAFPALSSLLDPKVSIKEELQKILGKQSRVFIIVQSSIPFTALLFEQAKQMGMMEKGNVWITTDGITSLLDSFSSSLMTSMEGVLGFKTFFFDVDPYKKDFKARFRVKFLSEYPEEENPDPSVFALRAYDAVWAVSEAMKRLQENKRSRTFISSILSSNFKGLSSQISFAKFKLAQVPTFQMVNVAGKSYREIGFWSPKFGFSKTLVVDGTDNKGMHSNVSAEEVLGSVFWPGSKISSPRGLSEIDLSTSKEKPLRIGVPAKSNFTQFVNAIKDENQSIKVTGFSADIFQAAVNYLPYQLAYEFIPVEGSYDEMVETVNQKILDAIIGDVEITADRSQLVEFSQPYVDSGLVMVVPLKPHKSTGPWMFVKPFTKWMWFSMAAMTLFTGVVIWVLEHRTNQAFRGPRMHQVGTVLWFSFSTLYLGQSDSFRTNLSRFVMAPWLFLVLIISASYTASLTSMLTSSRLESSEVDVVLLKTTNAPVGYDGSNLAANYLVKVVGLKSQNIKSYTSLDDFAIALASGHVRAGFFLIPQAKILIAKYCKDFIIAGPTYKIGGFGFVFPRNSSLALDISEAIQRLKEDGELQQLEDLMFSSFSCSWLSDNTNEEQSLGPGPFAGLFVLSISTSAIALFIAAGRFLRSFWHRVQSPLSEVFWKNLAAIYAGNKKSSVLQLSVNSVPQINGSGHSLTVST